jgi:hypothetical protein
MRLVLLAVLLTACQSGGGRPTDDVCIGICQYTQVEMTPAERRTREQQRR